MKFVLFRSKMARRLVRVFVLMVAVPLIAAFTIEALITGSYSRRTADTLEDIHARAIREAGRTFQRLGSQAVTQSSAQTQRLSIDAVNSVARHMQTMQARSLSQTARRFGLVARSNFDGAMRQSLATHNASLRAVQGAVAQRLAQSERQTQRQAAGHIEKAMLGMFDVLMQERAQRLADKVTDSIHDTMNLMTIAAQMPELHGSDPRAQKAVLDALVRRFPQLNDITVTDSAGQQTALASSQTLTTDKDLGNLASSACFRTAIKGGPYLAFSPSTPDKPSFLCVGVPIELYRGRIRGVLAASVATDDLFDLIRHTRIGKAGFAYVVDSAEGKVILPPRKTQGAILTSTALVEPLRSAEKTLSWKVRVAVPRQEALNPTLALKADIASNMEQAQRQMQAQIAHSAKNAAAHLQAESTLLRDATTRRMQEGAQKTFHVLIQTTARQSRREMASMQQAIVRQAAQTQQHSDQEMKQAALAASSQAASSARPLAARATTHANQILSLIGIGIMTLSCAIGGLVALVLAGRIVRPVVRLVEVTQDIAHGDLARRVEETAPDEIGDLAKAFNTMAASLQHSREELNDAEAQLVQSAKLASLGTLSAGVAHELNQPVAIIRGLAQQLADEPGLSEDVTADLALIEKQTGRMMKIITHLRTFSRVGNEEMAQLDVNKIVEDCFILLSEQMRAHNIAITFALCEDPPVVMGDANELEQVFINLVTNARDALEGCPDACITLRSRVEGDRFILEVADNGPGVPETIAGHIFDPFFTTKEAGKGTGLGLSISHSIIRKHQGTLGIRNEGGAIFTISLPLAGTGQATGETLPPSGEALPLAA